MNPLLPVPATQSLQLRLNLIQAIMRGIIPLPHTQSLIFFAQRLSLRYALRNRIKNSFFSLEDGLLWNISNPQPLLVLQQAIIHFFNAGQYLQ